MSLRQCRKPILALVAVSLWAACAHAQYEVPEEIFLRTLLIRNGAERATAFKFDYDGRIYLVTTRHFAKGLPASKATIEVWRDQNWGEVHTSRVLFPPSGDVDIGVIEMGERIGQPYVVTRYSGNGAAAGQQVWFMARLFPVRYPFTAASAPSAVRGAPIYPMVGKGVISAIEMKQPDSIIIQVDGPNARSMAGGPIVWWNAETGDYEVLGVAKKPEPHHSESASTSNTSKENSTKSSVLTGYSIDYVVQAITAGQHP
jgi:hypothetical protein